MRLVSWDCHISASTSSRKKRVPDRHARLLKDDQERTSRTRLRARAAGASAWRNRRRKPSEPRPVVSARGLLPDYSQKSVSRCNAFEADIGTLKQKLGLGRLCAKRANASLTNAVAVATGLDAPLRRLCLSETSQRRASQAGIANSGFRRRATPVHSPRVIDLSKRLLVLFSSVRSAPVNRLERRECLKNRTIAVLVGAVLGAGCNGLELPTWRRLGPPGSRLSNGGLR